MAESSRLEVPPSLVSNLKEALKSRIENQTEEELIKSSSPSDQIAAVDGADSPPCVLVTNEQGFNSPGLQALVQVLLGLSSCNVYVCVPQRDYSGISCSTGTQRTFELSQIDIQGVTAYELSGTTVDCVSLSLSGTLFPKKPILVLCGINRGLSCGYHTFLSQTVAGAREAFSCGVPSLAFSLDWKEESPDDDFYAAAAFCLPLIRTAIRDAQNPSFCHDFFLNMNIPTPFSQHKGFRITRRGSSRPQITWRAATSQRGVFGKGFGKDNAIGVRIAQLGVAASAVGSARKANSSLKNIEVESVAGPQNGSHHSNAKKKSFYQMEIKGMAGENDQTSDYGALQEGFVTVTPLGSLNNLDVTSRKLAEWMGQFFESKSLLSP